MSTFYTALCVITLFFGFHHGPEQDYFLTVSIICGATGAILKKIDKLKS